MKYRGTARRVALATAVATVAVAVWIVPDTEGQAAHSAGAQATAQLARDASERRGSDGLRAGFSDEIEHAFVAGGYPTAVAWLPDRRMLATTKEGRLWVFPRTRQGYGRPKMSLDLSAQVCSDIERGLVGLAVDPQFEQNHFVYLYWTHDRHDECTNEGLADAPSNRVTRHRLNQDGREVPGSRTVIVDHIVSPKAHHIAGDLLFGKGGLLYISVGDGVCRIADVRVCGPRDNNSQLRSLPHGKILRVTRSGLPAPGNPYARREAARRCTRPAGVPRGNGPCAEIFASGFRNPYRMARRPGTNTFFVNDVGQDLWEEIDRLRKGANYGWNVREGDCVAGSTTSCGPSRFADPLLDYRHGDCRSITGGAFVPRGLWPTRFDGAYLFADYTCDTIFRLIKTPGGHRHQPFLTGVRRPVHLRFGPSPDGRSLYYINFFRREIHRVSYHRSNVAPVARFKVRPNGLKVALTGRASYDPDQDGVVSWQWDFGDGSTRTTSSPSTNHTYSTAGVFDVTLRVTDAEGAVSAPDSQEIVLPEHAPSLRVAWPNETARFAVGKRIAITAEASDREDGPLAGRRLRWEFRRRHGNHFHPLATMRGGKVRIAYPPPEDLTAAPDSSVLALVSVTDSRGYTTLRRHYLKPHKVRLSFASLPSHARIDIEVESRRTPFMRTAWEGQRIFVRAPDQPIAGRRHVFRSWSDGGARAHFLVVPGQPKAFTVRFRPRN